MLADWTALFPHIALTAGGLAVLGAATVWREPPRGLLLGLGLAAALCAGLSALVSGAVSPTPMILAGGLSSFFAGLIAVVTILTLLLVHRYAATRGFAGDALYGLLLWSALGMLLAATAGNWVILLVGIELLSLCLYALIALRRDDPLAAEAALKYFLPGAMALAILLFGIGLIYAGTGQLDIAASLAAATSGAGSPTAKAGLLLALVGIGFKLSLAPVHMWTPDVYQGAPAPVAAFLSTGSKAAVAAALLRLSLSAGPEQAALLDPVLITVAALSMAVGNITALCQVSVKRILAYSSIAQMGYVAMAVLAVRAQGAQAAMFYLGAYVAMELGAFGAVGLLSERDTGERNSADGVGETGCTGAVDGAGETAGRVAQPAGGVRGDRDNLDAYKGLGYSHPWRAGILALCLLSLAGLPPTAGFMGKFVVFGAVLKAGYTYLAVFGILMAVVALFFYLRIVAALYMQSRGEGSCADKTEAGQRCADSGGAGSAMVASPCAGCSLPAALACAVIVGMVFWLGLFPSPLLELIARLVPAL